jgi:hypothetical protein
MSIKPIIHGRDHRPGGADPIPGLTVPPEYAPVQRIPLFDDTLVYQVSGTPAWSRIRVNTALPNNASRNNYNNFGSTRTAAVGDALYAMVRIGPQGTWWGFNFGYEMGTDFGIFQISWAGPMKEADWNTNKYSIQPFFTIANPDRSGTYYQSTDFAGLEWITADSLDCYNVGSVLDTVGIMGDWRIMGGDGDILTTFTTTNPTQDNNSSRHGNGGPGIYWVKLEVTGKQASSSGYKVGLFSMTLSVFDDIYTNGSVQAF